MDVLLCCVSPSYITFDFIGVAEKNKIVALIYFDAGLACRTPPGRLKVVPTGYKWSSSGWLSSWVMLFANTLPNHLSRLVQYGLDFMFSHTLSWDMYFCQLPTALAHWWVLPSRSSMASIPFSTGTLNSWVAFMKPLGEWCWIDTVVTTYPNVYIAHQMNHMTQSHWMSQICTFFSFPCGDIDSVLLSRYSTGW